MDTKLNSSYTPQKKKLTDFPDEVLLKIFQYLSFKGWLKLQLVSRKWRNLLRDNSLWGNAKFLWGYTKEDTILPFKEKGTDRQVYAGRLIREVVSSTDLKFNNMLVTLPFRGNSNPVQQAKQVANIEDINGYYDLARVSSCYSDDFIREIANKHPNSLNYFHILKLAKIGPSDLMPIESWKDRLIVSAAVAHDGNALRYASANLKKDNGVVLAAVTNYGYALQYASDELKADRAFVLKAVTKNGRALQYASDNVKNDKVVVLAAITKMGYTLQYASDDLKNNRDVVLAAVTENGYALQYASDELKANRDVVLAAVANSRYALQYASKSLSNDQVFILKVKCHNMFCSVSEELSSMCSIL